MPTVLIGEAGGGGGISVMPVDVLMMLMPVMPPDVQKKIAEVVALKQASETGAAISSAPKTSVTPAEAQSLMKDFAAQKIIFLSITRPTAAMRGRA